MELSLNLTWVLLAAIVFSSWLWFTPRTGSNRRMQFVALAVLLLILFPVISVTDDLEAAQNPAETDCCPRRSHACSTPHSIIPAVAALPLPVFAGHSFGMLRIAAPGGLPAPVLANPALASIQNRPPPAA